MRPVPRLIVAVLLAHLVGTVAATGLLADRRLVVSDVPLSRSLVPVRFLPHLAVGPVLATHSLVMLIDRPSELPDKRLAESLGYWLPFVAVGWLAYRLLPPSEAKAGVCPRCGYDLRATPAKCPECGHVPAAVR